MRRLWLASVAIPIVYLLLVELLSVFLLHARFDNDSAAHIAIILGLLAVFSVPFTSWVFRTIGRHQREIAGESHAHELATGVLQAQEEERKRIARDLHDETAQSLSMLFVTLELCDQYVPVEAESLRAALARSRAIAIRTLDGVRALAHDVRPTILDDVGLASALSLLAEDHEKVSGTRVAIVTGGLQLGRLASDIEVGLFRIAQEALVNSRKHGRATTIHVELSISGSLAHLTVADDGRGFSLQGTEAIEAKGGLGLLGMRERAALVGGQVTIDSAPGRGTRIIATVPVVFASAPPSPVLASAVQ